ncbi:pyridoxal phosphate-dependent transferase [Colletotrichum lupini]|nr:pyridoxal phosphate-dependent transferase [Colletotrichum lupini]
MISIEDSDRIATTAADYHISARGAEGLLLRDVWGPREKSMGNPWTPENPNGTVILRLAENSLMHNEIADFIKQEVTVLPVNHLTYSTGPRGSHRLRLAAANFLTDEFKPRRSLGIDNILITPGLASAIDALAWTFCDEGDAILIPQPLYNGFIVDALNRSNVQVIGVSYTGVEGYTTLDDLFDPEVNRKAIARALDRAKINGIKVKALIISNPHNPLGRCYPPETLKVFARACGKNDLHFISDEIYAKSTFPNPAIPDAVPFLSTLSLDFSGILDSTRHHILYGASKDFCANGLRLGLVCTRNEGVMGALSSISIFSWSPHLIQDVWAAMLENKPWLAAFTAEKAERMVVNHRITTSFLREHDIRYFDTNAGLFIWVDLRHMITSPKDPQHQIMLDSSDIESTLEKTCKQREVQIADICMKHGVLVAPGHVYVAEEYGWFRLTFTVGKDALQEGLNRFLEALKEAEAFTPQA